MAKKPLLADYGNILADDNRQAANYKFIVALKIKIKKTRHLDGPAESNQRPRFSIKKPQVDITPKIISKNAHPKLPRPKSSKRKPNQNTAKVSHIARDKLNRFMALQVLNFKQHPSPMLSNLN